MRTLPFRRLAACLALGLFSAQAQTPLDVRIALVIGNAAYVHAPRLDNAAKDARAIAATLRGLGFTVESVDDANRAQMAAAIEKVRAALRGRQGLGMLYYAGHGVQVDWRNYMIPVDARLASAAEVQQHGLDLGDVVDAFKSAGTRMNILVLDACRDNPFSGAGATGKGLAPMDAPPGTFLAYATQPGNTAEDGEPGADNGPYAQYLKVELARPFARLEEVFKRVRFQVRQKTKGRQIPWESTSLEEEFAFNDGARASVGSADLERLAAEARARVQELLKQAQQARDNEARIAAELEREAQRQAAEAKRREEERLAAEARRREEERLAAEAKRREEERLAAEAKRRDEERLAAEAKRREEERVAAEARRLEDERLAAEAKRREDERLAAEAKRREDERLAAESRRREQDRVAEDARRRESERLAAEARRREDERLAAEAKRREDERLVAEARRREDDRAAEARQREQERVAAEARRRDEERAALEAKRREEERLAAEARRRDDELAAAEAKRREELQAQAARERERQQAIALALKQQRDEEERRRRDAEQLAAELKAREELQRLDEQQRRERQFAEQKAAWDRVRESRDPAGVYAFLQSYPAGPISELAQARLEQVDRAIVRPVADRSGQVQPLEARRFRRGDRYEFVVRDLLTKLEVERPTFSVIAADEETAEFNQGYKVTQAGAIIRTIAGATLDPFQQWIPAGEYQVGKRWTTRSILTPRGQRPMWVELKGRIVARETITVPAGTFDTYKMEMEQLAQDGTILRITYWGQPEWGVAVKQIREVRDTRGALSGQVYEMVARQRGS
jgi:uncharacterized caspase-like protein